MLILGNFLRKLSSYIQKPGSSFKRHNNQYESFTEEEIVDLKEHFAKWDEVNEFNAEQQKFGDLLKNNPQVRFVAVDIGAGAGWLSATLSRSYMFEKIIAIEPSKKVVEIAKNIFPKKEYSNIEWVIGFAEQVLPEINFKNPVAFFTGVVLSHLRDPEVAVICRAVSNNAPKGSILGFSECWGAEWHQNMWHVRTKEWWQKQLPEWDLIFFGPEIQGIKGRYKGIHGVKIK